ncbi:MAG: cell division protein FtsW [Clostridia bacterium]|nr:cell division protein FtsW [Clostridia bacterium]
MTNQTQGLTLKEKIFNFFTWRNIKETFFSFFKWRGSIDKYIMRGPIDLTFFIIMMVLLCVGLVTTFSASYVAAKANIGSVDTDGDAYYYLKSQLLYIVVGLVLMYVISKIKLDFVEQAANLAVVLIILLLIYTLINPAIIPGKESYRRWVEIIIRFQPSEFAKIILIVFLAASMKKNQKRLAEDWKLSVYYILLVGVFCVLILAENHLSATILVFAIGMIMIFLGGGKLAVFGVGSLGAGALLLVAWATGLLQKYMGDRIDMWLKLLFNEQLTAAEKQGDAWQILQSLYAIGSGGVFGVGLGQSRQKHLYIPEPQNDFVFSIACEEYGYIGAIIIMVLFMVLVVRGFLLAINMKDKFSSLLVMGICFHVGLQAALNMAVVSGTVPNTGIGLPFFSAGGSAMVTLLAEMGLVLSASRGVTKSIKGSGKRL